MTTKCSANDFTDIKPLQFSAAGSLREFPSCFAIEQPPGGYLLLGECARRLQPVAAAHPRRDDVLGHVEDAGVVAVLEAAAEGDGEDGEGQPTVQVLRKEGHDH